MPVDSSVLRAGLEAFAAELALDAAQLLLEQVQFQVPVRSGATRDLLALSGVSQVGGTFWVTLGSPTPQGFFQDVGTGPHVIKGNPWLAFKWNGKFVAFRERDGKEPAYVNHPGSRHYAGWFSDVVTPEGWSEALQRTVDQSPAFTVAA